MLGTILILVGSFLVVTWFGARKDMVKNGEWESEGKEGGYLWLLIYIGIIAVGFFI